MGQRAQNIHIPRIFPCFSWRLNPSCCFFPCFFLTPQHKIKGDYGSVLSIPCEFPIFEFSLSLCVVPPQLELRNLLDIGNMENTRSQLSASIREQRFPWVMNVGSNIGHLHPEPIPSWNSEGVLGVPVGIGGLIPLPLLFAPGTSDPGFIQPNSKIFPHQISSCTAGAWRICNQNSLKNAICFVSLPFSPQKTRKAFVSW